jgi:outer membrane lipase/esterase
MVNIAELGIGVGVDIAGLSLSPYLRATYIDVFVDNFRERGADAFDIDAGSQKVKSFTTDLGGQASYAISMPWGVLTPSISAEWDTRNAHRQG